MKVEEVLFLNVENNHVVNDICINSKNVKQNDIFFAIKGSKTDGNLYIEEAINKGAKTIITENDISYNGINCIKIEEINKFLALCCKRLYGDLSKKIKIIGVTGTNGKTTTVTLCYKYLRFINKKVALISTIANYINDEYFKAINTTPNILEIYKFMEIAIENDCEYLVMEVSSHAIYLNRIFGLNFVVGGLTNLTQDHLDFHDNIYDYHYSKIFFLTKCQCAIVNGDCNKYLPFFDNNVYEYGENIGKFCLLNAKDLCCETSFSLKIDGEDKLYFFKSNLLAKYNIYNLCLFISIMYEMGLFKYESLLLFLNKGVQIPGRLEVIHTDPLVIVDFAHAPDAVEKVLLYLNKYNKRIITVIGMGGNRDKSKRSIVGKISSDLSDIVIFTEDNSRNENVNDIINDIIKDLRKDNYYIEYDRYQAIKKALEFARVNDIVCILGRGCEEMIERNDGFYEFNDKNVAFKLLKKISK